AAFGMGRKTRYDRTVRDALQIKAEGGAFSVLHFDPAAAGILEQIRRELASHIPDALTAELYNLNVYGRGGHFVPHKDTPRGSDETGRSAGPGRGRETLNTLVRQKLRALLDDRRFLAKGGTLAFPCSHLYHQDARFQRKQRPISRQTISSLKGRDHVVAAA